jgi:hypothetical protein
MYLIIGISIVLVLIVVGTLIPPDARYEIWPRLRRLEKPACDDEDEDAAA